ncbi:DUF2933 domain-containing protein [Billgrantia diversa]|uniref:DUF2933 domain-containing protein n=1 Tax=Halomonas sp. MCCC 1A13316 TaxID=2733487 RepID=UPI0018A3F726|nr:DUF2933 domain-containing protein [Halomonas sp. MCCC 1A13316]QOR38186.1 DUF2933 domain-containing protein [Halomonas sp. MCCC 1A13316]
MEHDKHSADSGGQQPLRFWLPLGLFLAFVVYLLWAEHRIHFIQFLPFLILLACPLMHLFMHGGHHGKSKNEEDQ